MKVGSSEGLEDKANMFKVFLVHAAIDENVIQVDGAEFVDVWTKNNAHESLEGTWALGMTLKWCRPNGVMNAV
jgi:hypothetical protein